MIAKDETSPLTTATRLPQTVLPEHYRLRLTPDLKSGSFSGEVFITVDVKEPVDRVELNAAGLKVERASLSDDRGTVFDGSVLHLEEAQRLCILFNGTVGRGRRVLQMQYSGVLDPKLRGFYKSTYRDSDGNEQALAVTKFEPSDARRAMPCWDEPAFKAVFDIELIIDEELTAISNGRLICQEPLGNGKKSVKFAPSIKMSSYLAAWVVGRFESSAPIQSDNCQIRVWSVPGKKHLHDFGLDIAKFSLDELSRYFGIAYPSDKLDLIAIPDFASGAMENFGCVTFRETALLLDPKTASAAEFKRVANVTAHENSHMWFGDYTTMSWWNGLWLNEAAATFLALKVLEKYRPEWHVWDEFNIDKQAALRIDALLSTRSIEFPVGTPEEARAMFDVLTYEKGCAVLRMLELYLGCEIFQAGMRRYLQKHAFGNADTPDLWLAVQEAARESGSQVPVAKMMEGWVFQPGYPVVAVALDQTEGCIKVSQRRFTYLPVSDNTLFHIPLTIRALTDDGLVHQTFPLEMSEAVIYIGKQPQMVVVNVDGQGFYRVSYQTELREALLNRLDKLTVSERFNLVADLWASVLAGNLGLREYLAAAHKLCVVYRESNPQVWSVIISSLNTLRRTVDQRQAAALAETARRLIHPKLEEIGLEPVSLEPSSTAELRGALIAALSAVGDHTYSDKIAELFKRYTADRTALDANMVPAVIEATARAGDKRTYDEFLALRQKATTPQEEARLLLALALFTSDDLIERTLSSVLNGEIRTQDVPTVLTRLFHNPFACTKTWHFVASNWDRLVAMLPLQGVIRIIEAIAALIDPGLQKAIEEFLQTNTVKGSEKALAQTLELQRVACLLKARESLLLSSSDWLA